MEKKLLIGVIFLAVVGCVTPPQTQKSTHEVVIKHENGKVLDQEKPNKPEITKTMQVPYTEPELPKSAYMVGDTCYYTIWAYITAGDALDLHKSLVVMEHKGIKKMHILINSGGGSAFDGMAVADFIARGVDNGVQIETEASGVVASAAVPIFVAGAKRTASKGTVFMIHDIKLGKMFAFEGKDDLRSQQEMIEIEEDRYNSFISSRTKLSKDQIKEMCKRTTWFTAERAVDWGLVHEIR